MDYALLILIKLAVMYLLLAWGDFGLQNSWMAMEKGQSYEVLFYHAVTANAPIMLLWAIPDMNLNIVPGFSIEVAFSLSALAIVIRIASHAFIDALKARFHVLKSIKIDQLCHIAVDAGLILLGLV